MNLAQTEARIREANAKLTATIRVGSTEMSWPICEFCGLDFRTCSPYYNIAPHQSGQCVKPEPVYYIDTSDSDSVEINWEFIKGALWAFAFSAVLWAGIWIVFAGTTR